MVLQRGALHVGKDRNNLIKHKGILLKRGAPAAVGTTWAPIPMCMVYHHTTVASYKGLQPHVQTVKSRKTELFVAIIVAMLNCSYLNTLTCMYVFRGAITMPLFLLT